MAKVPKSCYISIFQLRMAGDFMRFSPGLSMALLSGGVKETLEALNRSGTLFHAVEAPGAALDEGGITPPPAGVWSAVTVCGLVDPSLPPAVVRDRSLENDFLRLFHDRLLRAAAFGARSVTADFPLDSAAADAGFHEGMRRLLGLTFHSLWSMGLTMMLPVATRKLSAEERVFLDFCANFMRGAPRPSLRCSLSVRPHEMKDAATPAEIMRPLRFDTAAVRLVYEPETGNHLTERAVAPWISWLDKSCFSGMLLFCPKTSGPESFLEEAAALEKLLRGISEKLAPGQGK
jgi:hypothetical protein